MKSFYFNNSSLPLLACATRYVYQVVRGAVVPDRKSDALATGIVFHRFMQLLGTARATDEAGTAFKVVDILDLILNDKLHPAEAAQIKRPVMLSLIESADRMIKSQPLLFADHRREVFFELPETITANGAEVTCINCGTIDLLSYIPHEDAVYITDYKTTEKELNGNLVTQYTLSSQWMFYETALLNLPPGSLPDHYTAAIKARRVKFAYWFYNHKTKQDVLLSHAWLNERTLAQFNLLLSEKKQYAALLHLHPGLAAKEGMLFNQCFNCPFTSICEKFDDKTEAQLIENWAAGFKPYYPKH